MSSRQFACEQLESRTLLSLTPVSLPIPKTDFVTDLTAGPRGSVWGVYGNTQPLLGENVLRIDANHRVTKFVLPRENGAALLTPGYAGTMWFLGGTKFSQTYFGRISAKGTVRRFAVPGELYPVDLVAGPGKKMWFLETGYESQGTTLGSISPAGKITLYPLETLIGATRLWSGLSVTSSGTLQFISTTNVEAGDGGQWYTFEFNSDGHLLQKNLITGTIPGYFQLRDGSFWQYDPSGLTKLDSNLAEAQTWNYPGGTRTEFMSLQTGPFGKYWFIVGDGNIGYLNPDGTITQGRLPDDGPVGTMAYAADGNLWVADGNTNKVSIFNTDNAIFAIGQTGDLLPGATQTVTLATFKDFNASSTIGDLSAKVLWSDGATSSAKVSADGAGGYTLTAERTATSLDNGATLTAAFTINDAASGQRAYGGATFTNKYPTPGITSIDIAPVAGELFTGRIAHLTNLDASTISKYLAIIDWGNNFSTPGTIEPDGAGGAYVVGSYRYAQAGSYIIDVRILNPANIPSINTLSARIDPIATVSAGAIAGTGYTELAFANQPFDNMVAHFDPTHFSSADLSHYHASFTWIQPGHAIMKAVTLPAVLTDDHRGGFDASVAFDIIPDTPDVIQSGVFAYDVNITDDRTGSIVAIAHGVVAVAYYYTYAHRAPDQFGNGQAFPYLWEPSFEYGNPTGIPGVTFVPGDNVLTEQPTSAATNLSSAAGQAFTADIGTISKVFSGVFAPGAPAGVQAPIDPTLLSGVIQWGDGTASVASFVVDSDGTIHVRGTHTYAASGTYTVSAFTTQSRPDTLWPYGPVVLPKITTTAVV